MLTTMHMRALGFVLITLIANVSYVAGGSTPLMPTHPDVPYGTHQLNLLDFWKAEGESPRPLLVYIHGGGWTGGDKKRDESRFRPFLEKGISYAAINYRLTGEVPLPAPVHDAARAIQFLRSKASEWNMEISHGFTITANTFWSFYYTAAGLHALHVIFGIGIIAMVADHHAACRLDGHGAAVERPVNRQRIGRCRIDVDTTTESERKRHQQRRTLSERRAKVPRHRSRTGTCRYRRSHSESRKSTRSSIPILVS